ncbi:type 4a pilus biogenesis protein PilO [Candidatus Deferrimicrobium sp.]|uniref:type 4a pilus biogenesis protein PilO n=1 Tax=Candidatus Deferrimicrobium sp. TaxID=3060586 RepID=UPI002ED03D96
MALKLGDLSKVPPRQKILLAVLFCGLVVSGYYYLYYREASQRIGAMEAELASLQSKIQEQQAIAANLRSFQDEVRRLEAQLSLLLEQLPNSAEIPSLLKSISDLGKDSGLEFLRFAPSGEVKKDFYAEIPVSISVNGDYHSFALFSDKVAHYPRIVNLSNIVFSSPKPSGDNIVLVTVNCTATTYRFLDQQAASAPGAGAQGKNK